MEYRSTLTLQLHAVILVTEDIHDIHPHISLPVLRLAVKRAYEVDWMLSPQLARPFTISGFMGVEPEWNKPTAKL